MITDRWTIKQIKYTDTTFIKFTDENDTEFIVKSEDLPRLEFIELFHELRERFKNCVANPILNTPSRFVIYAIDFKYKKEKFNAVSFTITVFNKENYNGELKVSDLAYPTSNDDLNKVLEKIMHEANYILLDIVHKWDYLTKEVILNENHFRHN